MKWLLALSVGLLLAAGGLLSPVALAQGPEYVLNDYMPEVAGSTWRLKTMREQGEETITYEMLPPREVDGQNALPIVMKDAEGQVRSGTLQATTPDKVTIFGSLRRRQPPKPARNHRSRFTGLQLPSPAGIRWARAPNRRPI